MSSKCRRTSRTGSEGAFSRFRLNSSSAASQADFRPSTLPSANPDGPLESRAGEGTGGRGGREREGRFSAP